MVLSEIQRAAPDPNVSAWLANRDARETFISTPSIGEIRFGIARLAAGKKRETLERWFTDGLLVHYRERTLDLDTAAAIEWGNILAAARDSGKPIADIDAQIAAIAKVHSLTLVTRNVRHFADCRIDVIDPWR